MRPMDATAFQRMQLSIQTSTHPAIRTTLVYVVRFTATCPPYHAGEVAQFAPAQAQLIAAGLATAAA